MELEPRLRVLERMSVRGDISVLLLPFIFSHREKSHIPIAWMEMQVWFSSQVNSLLHLPKILWVHCPGLFHPIPVWQVEEKIEARREVALLLVAQICPEHGNCWPDVSQAEKESPASWNCVVLLRSQGLGMLKNPVINICYSFIYLGMSCPDPFIMKSSHLLNFNLNFLLKPVLIQWPPVLYYAYSERFLSLVMIFTGVSL